MPVNPTARNPSRVPKARVRSRQSVDPLLLELPAWVHPGVAYWYCTWALVRDCVAGEKQIKEAGTAYLPMMEGMEAEDYKAFKHRATFYNFTARTIGALGGSIFRRQPVIDGLPERLAPRLQSITKDGASLLTFSSFAAEEVFQTNHFGVLIDLPPNETTDPQPFLVGYQAEHILDWDEGRDPATGRTRLERVVLRETEERRDGNDQPRRFFAIYRELFLEDGVYKQRIYRDPTGKADAELVSAHIADTIVPLRRGEPLDYIPFRVFGPFLKQIGPEKPSMEDIARLNISHYQSYAYLEHGRFYAGFPVRWSDDEQLGDDEFVIGSSRMVLVGAGKKVAMDELNGQGLKFLVDALDQKEAQAASLGGRMIGIRGTAVSESDNQLKLAERNEQALLLRISRNLDEGFTQILRWWGWWSGMSQDEAAAIEITFNKDFLFDQAGAREFRAIHALYKDGVIPIEIVYEYLKKFNVIPDWMSLKEFTDSFSKLSSFPGDPDAKARKLGYPDAKTMWQVQDKADDRTLEEDLLDTELEHDAAQQEAARKAAKAAARERPAADSARGAFGRK